MIVEGFISYQYSYEDSNFHKEFDNFLVFKDGYIVESGFLKGDSFFTIFIGGSNKETASNHYFSNLQLEENFSSNCLTEVLNSNSPNNPKIGIWYNEKDQTFHFSRDIFGSVPLFYIHIPGIFIAFSTSLIRLINKKEVKPYLQINSNKIITYTSDISYQNLSDITDTFFTLIKSVAPGHLLKITRNKVISSTPFETFNPEKWTKFNVHEDYSKAVNQVLKKSNTNGVSNTSKIGSHLSGGLDSSSVSSTFKFLFPERSLDTFHINANNKESDESEYASLVANHIQSIHHNVAQSKDDLNFLKLATSLYGQPESSYISPATNLNTISFAKKCGCNILLNGHGGDSIIGNGIELLDQAFEQKNWLELSMLLKKRVPYFNSSIPYPNWEKYSFDEKFHLVLHNFLYSKLSIIRKHSIKKLIKLYREISNELDISAFYFVKRASINLYLRLVKKNVITKPSILRKKFIESIPVRHTKINHSLSLLNGLPNIYTELFEDVFNDYTIHSLEQHFVLSNYFGISIRAPYLNKELMELCMAIPDSIKYGDGIGRNHLREAMKDILVEEIRTRSTKITLSSPDGEDMTFRLYNQSEYYLERTREIWKYIDQKKFNEQVTILKNNKIPYIQKSKTYFHITRTISLSVWLEWLKENQYLN